jgi:hypothetical protein
MKKLALFILTMMLCVFFAGYVLAESATKEEVIAKCKEASQLIQDRGMGAASMSIGDKNGPFVWKDTYVFLMDMDGKMLAHPIKPELTERDNLLAVKDKAGKPFFLEFVEVAASKKATGWVKYKWPKPGEENPTLKNTYILRVPGSLYFVGAGIYE